MLDESDPDNNTYYLEKNLNTVKETEYVSFETFFAEESSNTVEDTVEIVFVNGKNNDRFTEQEMIISDRLSEFTGIYTL